VFSGNENRWMLRRDSLLVSSNQRKQMATKLTDDFAVEVLSQLLFKAFCRFKCVCKAWLAFSSDPHYCQKLLKFPLVLCTIAALLLMEELMELLIYRHSTSSFVLLTGLIAKSFFSTGAILLLQALSASLRGQVLL